MNLSTQTMIATLTADFLDLDLLLEKHQSGWKDNPATKRHLQDEIAIFGATMLHYIISFEETEGGIPHRQSTTEIWQRFLRLQILTINKADPTYEETVRTNAAELVRILRETYVSSEADPSTLPELLRTLIASASIGKPNIGIFFSLLCKVDSVDEILFGKLTEEEEEEEEIPVEITEDSKPSEEEPLFP